MAEKNKKDSKHVVLVVLIVALVVLLGVSAFLAWQYQQKKTEVKEMVEMMEFEKEQLADEYEGDNLSSMLPLLSFAQFYEFDCQDFSEYGLDNPQMVVRVMYHETVQDENQESKTVERNLVLSVGDYDETGYYYVRMNDSKEVHGIAETYINKTPKKIL